MYRRARIEESQFRHGPRGLEPLAPPGEGGHHVHYLPNRQSGLGVITSKKPRKHTFFEYLAFELGVNVTEAKRLWDEGKIR